MAEIRDVTLEKRNTLFEPTVIWALIICETDFDFFKDPVLCKKAAENQQDYLSKKQNRLLNFEFFEQKTPEQVKKVARAELKQQID